jgi:hypothetical protein
MKFVSLAVLGALGAIFLAGCGSSPTNVAPPHVVANLTGNFRGMQPMDPRSTNVQKSINAYEINFLPGQRYQLYGYGMAFEGKVSSDDKGFVLTPERLNGQTPAEFAKYSPDFNTTSVVGSGVLHCDVDKTGDKLTLHSNTNNLVVILFDRHPEHVVKSPTVKPDEASFVGKYEGVVDENRTTISDLELHKHQASTFSLELFGDNTFSAYKNFRMEGVWKRNKDHLELIAKEIAGTTAGPDQAAWSLKIGPAGRLIEDSGDSPFDFVKKK